MREIRAVVVGFGEMGRLHLSTLRARPGVRVVGVVRQSEAPAGPVVPSVAAALALGADLAVIATPHHLHAEQVRACLDGGCHVLVEKSLALGAAEAADLAARAAAAGRHLVVGLQRRYEGLATIFRHVSAAGELGRVRLVHGLFAHRFAGDPAAGWRADPAAAGHGILDDSGVHLLDLLLYLAGGRVTAAAGRVLADPGAVPHSFAGVLHTDAGVTVSACGSYLSPARSVQEEVSVYGEAGALFARRFRPDWSADPPAVVYKSADGAVLRTYDMSAFPCGRALPLTSLLDVLQGQAAPDTLYSAADRVLEAHRAGELLRAAVIPLPCHTGAS